MLAVAEELPIVTDGLLELEICATNVSVASSRASSLTSTVSVPVLAPAATLKGVDTARIGLDYEKCMEHARQILPSLAQVQHKVIEVFSEPGRFEESTDPDRMLYSGGFFSTADRHLMNKILDIKPTELGGHLWSFQDERLQLMLFRYRARNFPETLNLDESRLWERDRRSRLVDTTDSAYFTLDNYRQTVSELREARKDEPEALEILDKLDAWVVESGLAGL